MLRISKANQEKDSGRPDRGAGQAPPAIHLPDCTKIEVNEFIQLYAALPPPASGCSLTGFFPWFDALCGIHIPRYSYSELKVVTPFLAF
jgi:hypothetical protein